MGRATAAKETPLADLGPVSKEAVARVKQMGAPEKAALVLMALGADVASEVLKHFKDSHLERLMGFVYNMKPMTQDVRDQVLEEFLQQATGGQGFDVTLGSEYLRDVLTRAMGKDKAEEILERIGTSGGTIPFQFIREADPVQLARFLEDEHPQTIALVLAHLRPTEAARVLANVTPNLQAEVAARVAMMDRTAPEIIKEVETGLRKKLAEVLPHNESSVAGGLDFLVRMLNQVDRATEKTILESLAANDPTLAEQVQIKMFVFEDLIHMDDRSLQMVLQRVDQKDLLMALRGASEGLRDNIFRNMSSRARKLMEDDLAAMGPVRLRNVEEAQQRIVTIVRQMEEAEEIVVTRGGRAGEVLI